jgi:hypothetical protein
MLFTQRTATRKVQPTTPLLLRKSRNPLDSLVSRRCDKRTTYGKANPTSCKKMESTRIKFKSSFSPDMERCKHNRQDMVCLFRMKTSRRRVLRITWDNQDSQNRSNLMDKLSLEMATSILRDRRLERTLYLTSRTTSLALSRTLSADGSLLCSES